MVTVTKILQVEQHLMTALQLQDPKLQQACSAKLAYLEKIIEENMRDDFWGSHAKELQSIFDTFRLKYLTEAELEQLKRWENRLQQWLKRIYHRKGVQLLRQIRNIMTQQQIDNAISQQYSPNRVKQMHNANHWLMISFVAMVLLNIGYMNWVFISLETLLSLALISIFTIRLRYVDKKARWFYVQHQGLYLLSILPYGTFAFLLIHMFSGIEILRLVLLGVLSIRGLMFIIRLKDEALEKTRPLFDILIDVNLHAESAQPRQQDDHQALVKAFSQLPSKAQQYFLQDQIQDLQKAVFAVSSASATEMPVLVPQAEKPAAVPLALLPTLLQEKAPQADQTTAEAVQQFARLITIIPLRWLPGFKQLHQDSKKYPDARQLLARIIVRLTQLIHHIRSVQINLADYYGVITRVNLLDWLAQRLQSLARIGLFRALFFAAIGVIGSLVVLLYAGFSASLNLWQPPSVFFIALVTLSIALLVAAFSKWLLAIINSKILAAKFNWKKQAGDIETQMNHALKQGNIKALQAIIPFDDSRLSQVNAYPASVSIQQMDLLQVIARSHTVPFVENNTLEELINLEGIAKELAFYGLQPNQHIGKIKAESIFAKNMQHNLWLQLGQLSYEFNQRYHTQIFSISAILLQQNSWRHYVSHQLGAQALEDIDQAVCSTIRRIFSVATPILQPVNLYDIYQRYWHGAKFLLLPYYVVKGLLQLIWAFQGWLRRSIHLLRDPQQEKDHLDCNTNLEVVKRKIHRSAAPGITLAMLHRAASDPEYLGLSLSGVSGEQVHSWQKDANCIDMQAHHEAEFAQMRLSQHRTMTLLEKCLPQIESEALLQADNQYVIYLAVVGNQRELAKHLQLMEALTHNRCPEVRQFWLKLWYSLPVIRASKRAELARLQSFIKLHYPEVTASRRMLRHQLASNNSFWQAILNRATDNLAVQFKTKLEAVVNHREDYILEMQKRRILTTNLIFIMQAEIELIKKLGHYE